MFDPASAPGLVDYLTVTAASALDSAAIGAGELVRPNLRRARCATHNRSLASMKRARCAQGVRRSCTNAQIVREPW